MSGKKFDTGKPRMDLLPSDAIVEVAKVLTFGAQKYGDGNWANGLDHSRLYAAAERHLADYNAGNDIDEESGLHALAHAACDILMLLWMIKHRPELDNRWIKTIKASGVLTTNAPGSLTNNNCLHKSIFMYGPNNDLTCMDCGTRFMDGKK